MLSENQVVALRKAIELQYIGVCTIVSQVEYIDEGTKITTHKEVVFAENQPCKLSYTNAPASSTSGTMTSVSQTIKLFIAPEIAIAPGSSLTITQNGVTSEYNNSGEPAVFATHQEVGLILAKGVT